jgi:hypothetical protein
MRTAKKIVEQKLEKKEVDTEVNVEESVSFLDRHNSSWFIDANNNLKVGKTISDFFNEVTENFIVKKVHLCDVRYWKVLETTDGKFILLSRTKLLK